jgi:hypothetical protein
MNNSSEINKVEKLAFDPAESGVENLDRVESGTYEFGEKAKKGKEVTGVEVVAEEIELSEEASGDEIKGYWSAGFQTSSKVREKRPNARIVDSNVWIEALMRKIRQRRVA